MGTQKYVQLTNAQGCFYTSTFKLDCPSKGYKAVLQRDFSRNEIYTRTSLVSLNSFHAFSFVGVISIAKKQKETKTDVYLTFNSRFLFWRKAR